MAFLGWKWADFFLDVTYLTQTDFNKEWMWYASLFMIILPPVAYFIKAFEISHKFFYATAVFIASSLQFPHALH